MNQVSHNKVFWSHINAQCYCWKERTLFVNKDKIATIAIVVYELIRRKQMKLFGRRHSFLGALSFFVLLLQFLMFLYFDDGTYKWNVSLSKFFEGRRKAFRIPTVNICFKCSHYFRNDNDKKSHWLQVSTSKLQGHLSGSIKLPIFQTKLSKKFLKKKWTPPWSFT